MMNDIDIKLIGDNELAQVIRNLDYVTQQRFLKNILADVGRREIVKYLKIVAPMGQTGNLRRSMGVIRGKAKNTATVFVGPRLSHKESAAGKEGYKGWVANILEFAKSEPRTPKGAEGGRFQRSGKEPKKTFKPFVPGLFLREISPIRKRTHFTYTIESRLKPAEVEIKEATRRVIERTWKNKSKQAGLGAYAVTKGRE